MNPHTLSSERDAYETGFLDAGDGHQLYYARYGNPAGEPVVYLHGGPGAGCRYQEYRFFDTAHYNVLLFDQRGAPRSKPFAGTHNNNMPALVNDLEKLRKKFGFESWNVTGGSAGSTLGMLYAVTHPQRVKRLLLRGIFFGDALGAYNLINAEGPLKKVRNQWFEEYLDHIPPAERADGLTMPYYNRLTSADETIAIEAARLFTRWDTAIATKDPQPELLEKLNQDPRSCLPISRLFFHFTVNDYRVNDYKPLLLEGMRKLTMPIDIIHGRQDWICPVESAIELHAHCSQTRLTIVENTGHGMVEPGLQQAFIGITEGWKKR